MKFVIITGNSAVGKMTVGQELRKITDLQLMHNHITIEPVIEVFGYYDNNIISRLRDVMFEEFAKTDQYGLIFTCMLAFNVDYEIDWIKEKIELMEKIKGEKIDVYLIELNASLETRLRRNVSENRLEHKVSKRNIESSTNRLLEDDKLYRFTSYEGEAQFLEFNNYLRIVNDDISAENQAKMIKEYFDF